MDILLWIQEWYKNQCNGDWEHEYGVTISNIDNPGWSVSIDIKDTDISDKSFKKIELRDNEKKWMICYVENGCFKGYGDPSKLMMILNHFKHFVLSE